MAKQAQSSFNFCNLATPPVIVDSWESALALAMATPSDDSLKTWQQITVITLVDVPNV